MTSTNPRAGRKEWIALGVLVLPLLLISMDITVLYFAVPSIAAQLAPSSTQQLWMTDIYGFVLAGMLITMGYIGDLIGRRKLLLIGSAVFGIASVTAAYSGSAEMLIAARLFQGLGGAMLMPSTLALVSNMFRVESQRRTAISIWAIGTSAGSAIGPVVSGSLLNYFWWGSIFLINVPVLVLLFILAPLLVPEFRRPKHDVGTFDLLSSVLSLVAVLSIIWGLKEFAVGGFAVARIAAIVVGVVLAGVFLYRQTHLPQPMIDPQLFKRRGFTPAISLSMIAFCCLIGFSLFVTQYLIDVLHMSPLVAALWTMPPPAATMLLAPFAVVLANKGIVRPAYIIAGALLVAAAGFACMTMLDVHRNVPLLVVGVTAIGVGSAIVLTLVTDLVVAAAPPERAGSVSALTQTFQEFGGALGIAVFGSLGAAIYGYRLDHDTLPGIPADTVQAARQTLGGATDAAAHLASGPARELMNAVDSAFTDSMNAAAALGIVITVATALFTAHRLRHVTNLPSDLPVEDTPQAVPQDARHDPRAQQVTR